MTIGLLGLGVQGQKHLAVLRGLGYADVVTYDPVVPGTVKDLKAFFRAGPTHVAVVTPTPTHLPLGLQAIGEGCHVLMEKPIAHTIQAAEQLVTAAQARGVALWVNHGERWNRDVLALPTTRPVGLVALRQSMRSVEESPILRLMIHDIDLAHMLFGTIPKAIHRHDPGHATLIYATGIADLHVGMGLERKMWIYYREGVRVVDFSADRPLARVWQAFLRGDPYDPRHAVRALSTAQQLDGVA